MTLRLYAHPFSSYCQKVLIALCENGTPFALRLLGDEAANAEHAALRPLRRMPVHDALCRPANVWWIRALAFGEPRNDGRNGALSTDVIVPLRCADPAWGEP